MKKFILSISLVLLLTPAFAQHKWGVVNLSVNYMREKPDYDEEMGDQALMGTVVEVLDKEGYWFKIRTEEPYVAWTTDMGLTLMDEKQIEDYIAAPKQICTVRFTWIFSEPTEKSGQLCDFVWGDLVRKTGITRGKWSKVLLPDGRYGWVKTKEVCDFDKWVAGREASEQSIVSTAMKFNGIPYFWGGTSIKGVDCSGLARCTYFLNGILLPRNASHQVKCGVEIPYSEAHPGDLVFFGREATDSLPERISHVAIYLGNDKIIHSSLVVRINSLSPDGEDYYERKVLHTRRILGQQDKGTGVRSVASSRYYFNK